MTAMGTVIPAPHPFEFFAQLVWLDGRPLMSTIEPYRRRIFEDVLYSFEAGGRPRYNLALCGRAKKNWKTTDLILAGVYRLLVWPSATGNDVYLIANDEGQAADDLALAKKLVQCNPVLAREVACLAKTITRNDGRGAMTILPANDVVGQHGKTYLFLGYDEIHGYRNHDLFEALAPDPSRRDALQWITSYAGIRHAPGIPLYDLMLAGRRGDDPRMYFSWYGADFTTDPERAREALSPEARANPSMASWGNDDYLADQRRRLPTHKYRRLHLNLPGAPEGAAFSAEAVMSAIVSGRKRLPYDPRHEYVAFCDMSGGSNDDAVLAIAHAEEDGRRGILDCLVSQTGEPPFSPRAAVRKFVGILGEYGIRRVAGDAYAGRLFLDNFSEFGIRYDFIVKDGKGEEGRRMTKSDIYESFEPKLNAGEAELLDHPRCQEQFLSLVVRGAGKIDHLPGDRDDWSNAAAGAIVCATRSDGLQVWAKLGRDEPSGPPPAPEGPPQGHVWARFPASAIGTTIQVHDVGEFIVQFPGRTPVPEAMARSEAFQKHLGRFLVEG